MTIYERAPLQGEAYNVASGQETTIFDLARLILCELGKNEAIIRFDGEAVPGNPSQWCADISCIAALGYASKISLRDGIRDLIVSNILNPSGYLP